MSPKAKRLTDLYAAWQEGVQAARRGLFEDDANPYPEFTQLFRAFQQGQFGFPIPR